MIAERRRAVLWQSQPSGYTPTRGTRFSALHWSVVAWKAVGAVRMPLRCSATSLTRPAYTEGSDIEISNVLSKGHGIVLR